MAEPNSDRSFSDEAQEFLGYLVIADGGATGILQLVEIAFDGVAQRAVSSIQGDAQLEVLSIGFTGTMFRAFMVLRALSES